MEDNKSPGKTYAPHLALIFVQLMFGSAAVLGKAALQAFPSYAIVGFRVGGAALVFYLLQRIGAGDLRLEKKIHYVYFALFSLCGVVVNQLLFFKGLSLTTATNTSLLAVMIPIFTVLVSTIIGNDRLTWRKICGIALAGAGVVYLINPTQASFSSETTLGDILIILNCLFYGTFVALSKKLVSFYGALRSIAWLFLFAAVVNVPVGLYSLRGVKLGEASLGAWAALGAIVVFPTILAYYWNTWALARVAPSMVAIYTYLQPLIGFVLAVLFLGESWSYRLPPAMILIFAGVFLVTFRKPERIKDDLHLT